MKQFFVYIVASPSRTMYIGVTSDREGRIWQHKNKTFKGFTEKYGVDRLVYVEDFAGPDDAIAREKSSRAGLAQRRSDSSRQRTRNGTT
jgi:putative endonuclease